MGITLRRVQQPNHHLLNLKANYAKERTNHKNGSVYHLCVTHSTEHISHDILKAKGTEVMQPLINLSDKIDYSSTPRTLIHYFFIFFKVLQLSWKNEKRRQWN